MIKCPKHIKLKTNAAAF